MFGTVHLAGFLLASFLLWIAPGPDTIYIVSRSIGQGRRAGLFSALGVGTGTVAHTAFAAFGLSAVLAASATLFAWVKLAGAGYLIYIGVQMIRTARRPETTAALPDASGMRIYRQGVLTNLLNPKVALFFLAFLPQFVAVDRVRGPLPFLFLGLIFVVGGTIWCLLVATLAARAGELLRRNARAGLWLERLSGAVCIGLGLTLLRRSPAVG